MPITAALATFDAKVTQCDSLVANAHRIDATGAPLFPIIEQKLITVAAFLNLFVAWEEFVEEALTHYMCGAATISGSAPTRYVMPVSIEAAKRITIGTNRYFDYANIENLRKLVLLYFDSGYPFEPHLSSIAGTLSDIRTMRNSSAHISSTTQSALEALAQRILGLPQPGIDLYTLLTQTHPASAPGTVFEFCRNTLQIAAQQIASG